MISQGSVVMVGEQALFLCNCAFPLVHEQLQTDGSWRLLQLQLSGMLGKLILAGDTAGVQLHWCATKLHYVIELY